MTEPRADLLSRKLILTSSRICTVKEFQLVEIAFLRSPSNYLHEFHISNYYWKLELLS